MIDTDTAIGVDVVVVGGGPAGLTAALALTAGGLATALVSVDPPPGDNRTTALLTGSVAALDALGVWAGCRAEAAPLTGIRIIDDTGRLIRAPEVTFDCAEIDLPAFGYNIENRHLVAALAARAEAMPGLTRYRVAAEAVALGRDGATVRLADGRRLAARLVIGADGRRSLVREAAGIAVARWTYPQTAVTLNLAHARPHGGISTEFHTAEGPFTLVPLPGPRSSLVCVVAPREADRLAALEDDALSAEVERRAHAILGAVRVEPGRARFPLGGETAHAFAQDRVALVGEAAHVFPPIGAQGLNLGLRDAAAIAELAVAAHRAGNDIGSPDLLARYDAQRRPDVTARTVAVDLLNRMLLADFLPVQTLRGLGLYLLDRVPPLRRAVMREGVRPAASEPRLMRGEAL